MTLLKKYQLKMNEAGGKNRNSGADVLPKRQVVSDSFRVRRATPEDADIVAWHRARMFQDMGDVSEEAFEILQAKARTHLEQWLRNGKYIGWLAGPADRPEMVVAGAGVQMQAILPRPITVSTIGEGQQGTIVNVFTEPQWRRRGIAGVLIEEIINWSKNQQLDRLILHASDEGRSIYEKFGFTTSNEMRFPSDSHNFGKELNR
jgi:GNAT superfamily N-acetyltransferase